MELPYVILPVEQDTPEWHLLRNNCIGSSDAAAIIGVSKWDTPRSTFRRKKGRLAPKKMTPSMNRGKLLEEDVRHAYMMVYNCFLAPCVVQCKENSRLIASLDGLSFEGDRAVEIKCPNREDHECAKNGKVPEHYWPQVQHALSILKTEMTFHYVSYYDEERVEVEVFPDWDYIQELRTKEIEFLDYLDNDIDPPAIEEEHIEITADLEQLMLIRQYKDLSMQIKRLQDREKQLKNQLIAWTDDGNTDFINEDGLRLCRLTRIQREGIVDWNRLCESLNINDEQVNSFRKQQVGFWKVS